MKFFPHILLFIVGIALGAVGAQFKASRDLEATKTENAAALAQAQSDAKQEAEKISGLEDKAKILNAESAALRKKLLAQMPADPVPEPVAAASATPAPAKNGFAEMLGKMLKDPAMKKAIAAQQSGAMRQFYSQFTKLANLTPDEAQKFYDWLANRQMAMTEKAGDFMNGGADANALAQTTADESKSYDDQLKALLGDARATQFQSYEKSLPDRMALDQINRQLTDTGVALNDSQRNDLLQIMSDERAKTPQPFKSNDPSSLTGLTDEAMQNYFDSQTQMNARVSTRAMSLLTPQQMEAFQKSQQQQLQMQQTGISMARQMFAPAKQ